MRRTGTGAASSRRARVCLLTPRGALCRPGRVAVVGVLNVTPDSFSDGGRYLDPGKALDHALAMQGAGADAIDVGGESTRPGALPVDAATELRRVLPVIERLRPALRVPISVDTTKAAVAAAALAAGADMVNDVSAGRLDPGMLPLVARAGVPVVLMHMRGTPRTMQRAPRYRDVVAEVRAFLAARAAAAEAAGVAPGQIAVDPGIGFGKSVAHNCQLLAGLAELASLGYPVLVGPSRKSFLGVLLGGAGPGERLWGTAAAVALAVAGGAALVRVHDVAAMVEVVRVAARVAGGGSDGARGRGR